MVVALGLYESANSMWVAAGRPDCELAQITRIAAERAFLAYVWPTKRQLAVWKASGIRMRGLSQHILERTGKSITFDTAERLWRFYCQVPEPRKRQTILDFLRGLPDKMVCSRCKSEDRPFHIDHVVSLKRGGLDVITNLQVLCKICNLKKGAGLDPNAIYINFEN